MKFLIDECLSPKLVKIARDQGFVESQRVNWVGLQSREDWRIVRRAVEDDFVLVTNNTTDFKELVGHQEIRAGLVCLTAKHPLMSLEVQCCLFELALTELDAGEPVNEVIEVSLIAEGKFSINRYDWALNQPEPPQSVE